MVPGERTVSSVAGLRRAKRTFRRATSNAEKTLLHVRPEAEEKASSGPVALFRYPVVPLRRKIASRGVYICITDGSNKERLSGASRVCGLSDSSRFPIDLRPTARSSVSFTRLAYIYFDPR